MRLGRLERDGSVLILIRTLIAVGLACLLVVLVGFTAHAQSWNSARTSGWTSVDSALSDGAYTWTLYNKSALSMDQDPAFDLLVWELIPFQVFEPIAWSAPEGWAWTGDRFRLLDRSAKYRTPYAIAPGSRAEFLYTPDPIGRLVNAQGPQPDSLGFITHVAAVIPGSGSDDGSIPWTAFVTQLGPTWSDRASLGPPESSLISEPGGLLVMAVGIFGLASLLAIRPQR